MKRVLEVFGEPISRGGQESYVMSAIKQMDLSELKIDLFTPYYCDNSNYVNYIEGIGGKIIAKNLPFVVGGTRREIVPVLDEYLKVHDYDIVHIHSGSISVLAYYARVASKNGIEKVIVHSHSSGNKENIKHILIKKYASVLFRKYATDFCACSIEAAKWKFPNDIFPRVQILNNGIDLVEFQYKPDIRKIVRQKMNISDDTLVLGHVGRFTYEKNQTFLIDVLQKYKNTYQNQNLRLILVGDGEELESVKNKVAEMRLADCVDFIGATDKVSDYLQAFDVFLFPSLYEGLGIVGIEAQSAGLPVIASSGIPNTMKVTPNVEFISCECINVWCDRINEYKEIQRVDNSKAIKQKGFDLKETAVSLQRLYFEWV